jgi:hypothetical protein
MSHVTQAPTNDQEQELTPLVYISLFSPDANKLFTPEQIEERNYPISYLANKAKGLYQEMRATRNKKDGISNEEFDKNDGDISKETTTTLENLDTEENRLRLRADEVATSAALLQIALTRPLILSEQDYDALIELIKELDFPSKDAWMKHLDREKRGVFTINQHSIHRSNPEEADRLIEEFMNEIKNEVKE